MRSWLILFLAILPACAPAGTTRSGPDDHPAYAAASSHPHDGVAIAAGHDHDASQPTRLARHIGSGTDAGVVINDVRLRDGEVALLERLHGLKTVPGEYWYDPATGAWGYEGGPTAAYILPQLDIGGSLKRNASNGSTGVTLNGRELPIEDWLVLRAIVPYLVPGRYAMDASGILRIEDGPSLGSIVVLAAAASARARAAFDLNAEDIYVDGIPPNPWTVWNGESGSGGGDTFYRSAITDIGTGSSDGTTYVIGDGFSYISD